MCDDFLSESNDYNFIRIGLGIGFGFGIGLGFGFRMRSDGGVVFGRILRGLMI
jgi:hypothetical protein